MRFSFLFATLILSFGCKEEIKDALTETKVVSSPEVVEKPTKGADGPVYASAVTYDKKILIVGDFSIVDGVKTQKIAKIARDGAPDPYFAKNIGDGANGPIKALALLDSGKMILGGEFNRFNGVNVGNLVCLMPSGTIDSACTKNLGEGTNGPVDRFRMIKGRIAIGGDFSTYNGSEAAFLAFIEQDGRFVSPETVFENPNQAAIATHNQ